jgi:hypothetical protein
MRATPRLGFLLLLAAAAVGTGAAFLIRDRDDRPTKPEVSVLVRGASPAGLTAGSSELHRYEYVFPDQSMLVYEIPGHRLVEETRFPQAAGIRGVAVSPRTHMLFISFGGDGGANGSGSMLAYDLVTRQIRWQWAYSTGIDSMAVSRDGKRIFLPTGELTSGGTWRIISASTGRSIGVLRGGTGPHNTVVGLDGRRVYLGGRDGNYLTVVSASNGKPIMKAGPLVSGVRPFTINGRQTLAFTTATGFLGFQVSSLRTGTVLYTVPVKGFTWSPRTFTPSAPSHGISLSPDERELWVIDAPNSYVHVFDVTGLPGRPPRQVADIRLRNALTGDETPCSYDCARDGWLQHSRDGRFVYVGDSGDVISTKTRRVIDFLPGLRNSRKSLEVDWRNGVPVFTTSRTGLGYVTR